MAKIIGEAGIRLRADSKGLAAEMRVIISTALKEATAGVGPGSTKGVEDDAKKTASKVKKILGDVLSGAQSAASGLLNAATTGARLALIGAAAGTALAGVSSLVTGIIGLVGVMGQASGVVGLLPAAFLGLKAVMATVQIGTQGVGDAFKALAAGDAAQLQDALNKLAPNARAFVTEVAKVKPQFDALKLNVQNTLFAGLSSSVAGLAKQYLPLARSLFGGLASDINAGAKEALTFAKNSTVLGQTTTLVDNIKAAFHNLVPAVGPVLSAFLNISQVGSGFLPQITKGITELANKFGSFIQTAASNGSLARFFQTAIDTVKQLFAVLGQFGGAFAGVFRAAQEAGGGFLNGLLQIGTAFNQFVNSASGQSALISFFSSMHAIIAAILPVFTTLAGVIGRDLAPILANLASQLGPALIPLVQALGKALQAAGPGIAQLAFGLGQILQAAAPLLPILGQVAGILAGALGKIFQALAPVIQKVADALEKGLNAVLPQLEPIIGQVADALAQLLTALVPLIPIFFQLLAAVLPILPPLIQLIAAVLPPLISLVQALMPIIQAFAQILVALIPPITAVVTTILNILIPPIQLIAAVVSQVAQIVADVFTAMSGVVTGILNTLGAVISGIWDSIFAIFTGAVNAIGNFVRGGFDAILNTARNIMSSIGSAISSGLDTVVGFFRELPGKIGQFFSQLASDAFNAGKNIIQGIINGLGSLAGAIWNKIKEIVSSAWNAVLDFFGIGSPSKLAEETFMWVGKGAIVGLERIAPQVQAAASDMAASAMAAMAGPLGAGVTVGSPSIGGSVTGGGAGRLGGGVILNQVNVMQPGTDALQFADEVSRRGAQKLAAGGVSLPVSVGSVQAGMASPDSLFGVSGVGS